MGVSAPLHHGYQKMQPKILEAARCEKEAQMAFVDYYVRHSTKMLDRIRFPRHSRNTLSSTPSMAVPAVRQECERLVTLKQVDEQYQQELSGAMHKSLECLPIHLCHIHLPLSLAQHNGDMRARGYSARMVGEGP